MKKYKVELFSPFTGQIVRTEIVEAESYGATHGSYTPGTAWTFRAGNKDVASYPMQYTIINVVS